MASSHEDRQLHIFLFPFLACGHILPMANIARLFTQQGIKSTIVTTPANAVLIHPFLALNLQINLLLLPFPSTQKTNLPLGCENTSSLPQPHSLHILNLFKAIDLLQKPFANLLLDHRPDYLISDWVYTWTTDLAHSLSIPRLIFNSCGAFSNSICDLLYKYKPHLSITDDLSPFEVPVDDSSSIPHTIELNKAKLPPSFDHPYALEMFRDAETKSFGTVLNSFYELEPWYVEFLRSTKKIWCVGPVGLDDSNNYDNRNNHHQVLEWLSSKDHATVIYICFGSECVFLTDQINEIAWGLEAAGRPFIWALRSKDITLPSGFEERMEGKGWVIRGWAPQVNILNHPAVGGFMTHCGWNSILEGVSAGLPMAAWPLESEQFLNEKLVVEVLGIGVKMLKATRNVVDKETVKISVEALVRGEESLERRRKAKEYQVKAKAALEEGGSSYNDLRYLIEELIENAKKRNIGVEG